MIFSLISGQFHPLHQQGIGTVQLPPLQIELGQVIVSGNIIGVVIEVMLELRFRLLFFPLLPILKSQSMIKEGVIRLAFQKLEQLLLTGIHSTKIANS